MWTPKRTARVRAGSVMIAGIDLGVTDSEVDYYWDVSHRSRIARYEPEELLASAGLVDTYRAGIDGRPGVAALKVLFLDRAEASIARAAAERFMLAGTRALQSPAPGIARVLEVSDDAETPFVATEWVQGTDLARLVQFARQPGQQDAAAIDPSLAALLCAQVGRVLAAAHELDPPLFHLGLCPANVVVTPAETVVLDFGLAAALRGMGGGPVEKWQFVAPELLGADATEASGEAAIAADLYSLGALLYYLLVGRPLVEGATLAELSERVWDRTVEAPGVPTRLLSVVQTLTAPVPEQRPKSARVAVECLCGVIDGPQARQGGKARQELARLGVPSSTRAAPAPSRRSAFIARTKIEGRVPGASMAAGLPKDSITLAARPGNRLARVLLTAGVLLAGGASVGGFLVYRGSREAGRRVDAGVPATPVMVDDPLSIPAEFVASHPPDGGIHPLAPEIPPTAAPYLSDSDEPPARVRGHLYVDTSPRQADVWVDGTFRGRTPIDLATGPGIHRVVVIKAGYRMWVETFDATRGQYARRGLQRVAPPSFGDGALDVQCDTADRFPIMLDDEETGLICPVPRLLVPSGKHHVGVFVPARRAVVAVEVTVPSGGKAKRVVLRE